MLTAKQENFVELLTQGTCQSSAYRGAYNTQNMSDKTVWEEASRLRKHPKVSIPIAGLIQFARQHNFTSTLLDYRNSGDTAGDRDRVVGYGALAYQTSDSG